MSLNITSNILLFELGGGTVGRGTALQAGR
jgi:hypothetical protein